MNQMNEIENIIVEEDFIIIITSDGSKRTIDIDNTNPIHKAFVDNIISMATSLVDDTNEDIIGDNFSNNDTPDNWGDFGKEDNDEEDMWN
tara:strand:+ start:437 stop:706 length:270 start_codon:yes stop_codon:yes gene_type:complete